MVSEVGAVEVPDKMPGSSTLPKAMTKSLSRLEAVHPFASRIAPSSSRSLITSSSPLARDKSSQPAVRDRDEHDKEDDQ